MSECADYWCDDYGKASGKCDRCEKKENVREQPDLRAVLKRRADKLMEIDNSSNRNKGMQR